MVQRESRRRAPVALLVTGALGILVAVGAALAGPLHFGGPRWLPNGIASRPPVAQTQPPASFSTPTPKPPTTLHSVPNLGWLAIVIGAVVVAFAVYLLVRWLLRRQRDSAVATPGDLNEAGDLETLPDEPSIETSMPYLRRGLQRALDVLDGSRRPTDAIIEAWLGLQEAAEDAGFQRQSAETPTEFTTRILRQVDVDPTALATLRRLYLAVRFGDRTGTDADVAEARAALLILQSQWTAAT
ncbi:hypothetical protein AX769_01595 [Frondihabitans sp. PAMC 28766]|uniref:DUF4129 domain-containing protein n=1 Tax=Frondihabitans sp. PAMC 28766 TaxID=1795630 RepID=UPI00078BA528|nr:DUF4129 domain-containing protein [Frondihabitans sp. PAMC 28766]AMM19067.1 hypothetical protein AX769_01595 [Frondihabitans sp. PAMC 28766]